MSTVSGQNTHPLTAVVIEAERRDPVGHLITDPNGDREYRFVKLRGGEGASQGMPLFAYKLSADEDTLAHVTCDAASMPAGPDRDLAGIMIGTSNITSGQHCYIMTKGRLGLDKKSLYPLTIFALTSQTTAAGDQCRISTQRAAGVSTYLWVKQVSAYESVTGLSIGPRCNLLAYSTDTGDKITRGKFRSPHYHGGLNLPPNA